MMRLSASGTVKENLWFILAGGASSGDVFHEEACGSHHFPVPCGGESVHPPPPAGRAALLDLP